MSIKILVTDPLSDKGLELLKKSNFEVIYKPEESMDDIALVLNNIDGWIIRSGTKILEEHILKAKKLQIIGRAGVGTDNIDIESATSNGIIVMNVPDGNTISAAEHTMAMISALSRNIQLGHMGLINGSWERHKLVGNELRGKILGVVGLGKIGREVIKRALSFDMNILGFDPYVSQEHFDKSEIKIASLDELTEKSDFITLHVPLNDATKDLFDLDRMKKMKKNSKIINVARGGIINEEDLAKSLNDGLISGAAIDVFSKEPIDKNHNLLTAKNILLTPHLGASTFEAKEGVSLGVCQQMVEFFVNEKLLNVLNVPISDSSLLKRMAPFYKLTEKMGSILYQLSSTPIKNINVTCYGTAEDSKSILTVLLKSILHGIVDSRINMINADYIAKERGVLSSHSYKTEDIPFLNLIKCEIETEDGMLEISGSVFDENHIRVVNIMGFNIDLNPEGNMLFVINNDTPGVVGKIGSLLGKYKVNIASYLLGRVDGSKNAYGVIKLDSALDDSILVDLKKFEEIVKLWQINVE